LAVGVLGFAVAAITQAIVAGQAQTYEALHHERGIALAEALLDEVLALPYADPDDASTTLGAESGESNRTLFDNCDDFSGFTETAPNIADLTNTAYGAPFDVFARSVTCAYGSETVTGFSAAIDGMTVTVTVTDDRGQQWAITRFIPEPAP
jgi:hypothetical protein